MCTVNINELDEKYHGPFTALLYRLLEEATMVDDLVSKALLLHLHDRFVDVRRAIKGAPRAQSFPPRPVFRPRVASSYCETQSSIGVWARETFGHANTNAKVVGRANQEMAELVQAVTADDAHPDAPEEAADVYIALCAYAQRAGFDLHAAVDAKMAVNRNREWVVDGGTGYHVRSKQQDASPTIAWRCKDFADGWILFHDEASAQEYQKATGCRMEELCVVAETKAVP